MTQSNQRLIVIRSINNFTDCNWGNRYNLTLHTRNLINFQYRERSGSLVECLTRDKGAAGSSLTGAIALFL